MALDKIDNSFIENEAMLVAYLAEGGKPKEAWRLGTEHEKFVYERTNYKFVPYSGRQSIEALLKGIQEKFHWQPILDEGNLIGLIDPENKSAISIEPGGQFELSGAPLKTAHENWDELKQHFDMLYDIADPLNMDFLGFGSDPIHSREETPKMPKSRYKIMTDYMPKVGNKGLDMMYRTATVQVNIDYADEKDMRRKMQCAMKIQPLITGLFALSPFTEGRPNGFLSWRSEVWRFTDKDRTGILPFVFKEDFGFQDYVNWALDIPMYFILRDGHYYDATYMTFRQFLNGKFKDRHPEISQPTLGDWVNHLSTLFPEVRLKQFLEMRGADAGLTPFICAAPALFAGIFYDEEALNALEILVKNWQYSDIISMREAVPKEGLSYRFGKIPLWDFVENVLEICEKGLNNRNFCNKFGQNETLYLDPLWKLINLRKTGAELALEQYETAWQKNIMKIFDEYSFQRLG